MTKTLTEQWCNGELDKGFYYIKTRWLGCDNKWHYNKEQDIDYLDSDGEWCGVANDSVVEIIGAVPSYDEWVRLLYNRADHISQLAKKVERLQKQLNEANELISVLFPLSMNKERALERTTEYMEKYGVK